MHSMRGSARRSFVERASRRQMLGVRVRADCGYDIPGRRGRGTGLRPWPPSAVAFAPHCGLCGRFRETAPFAITWSSCAPPERQAQAERIILARGCAPGPPQPWLSHCVAEYAPLGGQCGPNVPFWLGAVPQECRAWVRAFGVSGAGRPLLWYLLDCFEGYVPCAMVTCGRFTAPTQHGPRR